MPHEVKHLCAVGVTRADGTVCLLATNGRVWVFDTANVARNFLPLLGNGRAVHWSKDGERCTFSPAILGEVNRCCILTGYDPYHLPAGMPVQGETRGLDWKHHIHYTYGVVNAGQWAAREDGTLANLAAGEDPNVPHGIIV